MRKASLAVTALALLALAACDRGRQDQLNATDLNEAASEDLDALANQAANVASEAEQLENQAQQLDQEAQGAETAEEENIQGM
jgi:hypothetical protein